MTQQQSRPPALQSSSWGQQLSGALAASASLAWREAAAVAAAHPQSNWLRGAAALPACRPPASPTAAMQSVCLQHRLLPLLLLLLEVPGVCRQEAAPQPRAGQLPGWQASTAARAPTLLPQLPAAAAGSCPALLLAMQLAGCSGSAPAAASILLLMTAMVQPPAALMAATAAGAGGCSMGCGCGWVL